MPAAAPAITCTFQQQQKQQEKETAGPELSKAPKPPHTHFGTPGQNRVTQSHWLKDSGKRSISSECSGPGGKKPGPIAVEVNEKGRSGDSVVPVTVGVFFISVRGQDLYLW